MSTQDKSIHGECIKDRITQDMKKALAAKDKVKLSVTRLLKSEIRYKEIEKGSELSDDEIISVLSSSVKRHKDSIEQFEKGGREDLAAQEISELEIIWEYMPKQLEEDELSQIVDETIKETEVSGPSGLGKVMKMVMPKVKERADGKRVNELALSKLKSMSE
ncbi:MAG: hypothetical protein AMJ89_04255 [candidate division Zixibacteria bacterium SM23_73]|nr:MAG: hypothetical protein AMJ89_04255 [candidate division Zixibacteria bacterium SM23_73]